MFGPHLLMLGSEPGLKSYFHSLKFSSSTAFNLPVTFTYTVDLSSANMTTTAGGEVEGPRPLYKPLQHDKAEIRVLTLLPSRLQRSPLFGRIAIASLADDGHVPPFDSLSYVWGPPEFTGRMTIDGSELQITPNLEQALRHIRRLWRPRAIWVDQICINQDDMEERSSQVLLMGKIYSRAQRVLSWLGEWPSGYDQGLIKWALDWSVDLHQGRNFHLAYLRNGAWGPRAIVRKTFYALGRCTPLTIMRMREKQIQYRVVSRLMGTLGAFDELDYWTRMWICQEFALAGRTPLLLWGNLVIRGKHISAVNWGRIDGQLLQLTTQPLKAALESQERNVLLSPGEVEDTRAEIAQYQSMAGRWRSPSVGMTMHLWLRRLRAAVDEVSLSSLITMTYPLRCANPRDKIYALYSLVADRYQLPVPDYRSPLETVLCEVMSRVVAVDKSLSLFDTVSPSPDGPGPSWIPHYSSDTDAGFKRSLYHWETGVNFGPQTPKAGNGLDAEGAIDIAGLTLLVRGFALDYISEVFPIPSGSSPADCVETTWAFATVAREPPRAMDHSDGMNGSEVLIPQDIVNQLRGEESTVSVLLDGLVEASQTLDPGRRPLRRDGEEADDDVVGRKKLFDHLIGAQFASPKGTEDAAARSRYSMLRTRCECFEGSNLFVTRRGLFGFCYAEHDVRGGDVVVVLSTMQQPYVLRSADAGYKMLGSAWVSGIMEGELVELASKREHSPLTFTVV